MPIIYQVTSLLFFGRSYIIFYFYFYVFLTFVNTSHATVLSASISNFRNDKTKRWNNKINE